MADQNMHRIEPEQDQGTGPEQEKGQDQGTGQEPVKRPRGRPPRGSGRGQGREAGRGREGQGRGRGGQGREAGRGRGEQGREAGRGRGGGLWKVDFAIRETEAGSNQWRAKCYPTHRETDHVFRNKTAAAVSFDISHIIAIQRKFCKTGGRKGGCYLESASKQLLQDLMDVMPVKSYQRNGKDDLHSAVLVISRTLDEFLTGIRTKEDAEKAVFFYLQNPKDSHIIQLCFYREKISNPRHMRDVPGLEEIVEKHLEVLVLGLPDNPSAALHSVAAIQSDDEQIGGAVGNLQPLPLPLPPPLPEEVPVARSKRKAAEDNTVEAPVARSKKQRKKKDKDVAGDGGGGEDFGADERLAPSLILEVFTECPNHGVRKSRHYHFAHDCVCEAKNHLQNCFNFLNLDPTYRPYLAEDQLPNCFQEWRQSRLQMHPNI